MTDSRKIVPAKILFFSFFWNKQLKTTEISARVLNNLLNNYSSISITTLREENKFGRKECGIKDCELDL